jgi:hypothetical protein
VLALLGAKQRARKLPVWKRAGTPLPDQIEAENVA